MASVFWWRKLVTDDDEWNIELDADVAWQRYRAEPDTSYDLERALRSGFLIGYWSGRADVHEDQRRAAFSEGFTAGRKLAREYLLDLPLCDACAQAIASVDQSH